MHLATKTIIAIEEALAKDQGAKYRGLLRELMPTAEDVYRDTEESFRTHLGASLIGRECARELWYSFHWVQSSKFGGRMIRLFNRGHLEEPRMVALLRMIGCEVWQHQPDGSQFRMEDHHGHYSGSLDGVVRGIPDLPEGEACLVEFKTHNDKSFTKLVEEGVLKAKWEHFIQQQQYMGKMGLKYSLYCATNKNNDDIHMEIVGFDQVQYDKYLSRAKSIIESAMPPPKMSQSAAYFKCKFCDSKEICHAGKTPEKNCRTCEHSRPTSGKVWFCDRHGVSLPKSSQLTGCESYQLHSGFVK